MNLIAQIEAEQIAALGKTIPDFKAGDTVRVGYKVTEGTRTRVQNYEGVCIAARTARASPDRSPSARFPSARASSGCSRCISTNINSIEVVRRGRSVAPSSTICARAAASRPASPKSPTTRRPRAPQA